MAELEARVAALERAKIRPDMPLYEKETIKRIAGSGYIVNETIPSRIYIGSQFTCSPTSIVSNQHNAAGPFAFFESADGAIESHANGVGGIRLRASTAGSLAIGEGANIGTGGQIDITTARNPRIIAVVNPYPNTPGTDALTNQRIEIGFSDRTSSTGMTVEPTNGVFFRTTSGANWHAITRNGGTETDVDTGIAVSNNPNYTPQLLEVSTTATQATFKINNATVASITTNLPATSTLMGGGVGNGLITSVALGIRYVTVTELHMWWDQYTF